MSDTGLLHETATREADVQHGRQSAADPFRVLLLVTAQDGSQAIEFAEGRVLTIGRAEPSDILLADPSLSRLHARFERDGERVRITDLGSRNGTWFAGERVREASLRAGDVVVLGSTTVAVHITSTAQAAMLGLLSSSTLLRKLEEEWERAQVAKRPLSVAVIMPLRAGEVAISVLASECATKLRSIDRAGVFDRGSLLVLMPEMSADGAAKLGAELVAPRPGRGQLVCGIATYPEAAGTAEQLVGGAWQAARLASATTTVMRAPRAAHVREPEADAIVRRSPAMLELQRLVERIAGRALSVLVLGETGTGKELIAHELHRRSPRASAPLRVVNCAAIPDHLIESILFGHVKGAFTGADRDQRGVFEQAEGGTVFLDEVGELAAEAQAALLQVLDTRSVTRVGGSEEIAVDVRIVAATHRDLAGMTGHGSFRLDLLHRLNGFVLKLPPLRARREEIPALAEHFLVAANAQWGGPGASLSAEALALLHEYEWPGNVRELRNVIERASALCDGAEISAAELPTHIREPRRVTETTFKAVSIVSTETRLMLVSAASSDPRDTAEGDLRARALEHEAALIRDALHRSDGNRRNAAALLKLPLRTFERKLQQLRASDAQRADGEESR